MPSAVHLSIVIPAWNEAGVIGPTLQRIKAIVAAHPELVGRVEVIVVSDGSTDGTYREAVAEIGDVVSGRVVQLLQNVGSHAAIRAGMEHAHGDFVALLAADGQDPPELLPEMLEAFADEDVCVVWGRRLARVHDDRFHSLTSATYYRIFRRLTGMEYPAAGLDFVVLRRVVVEAVLSHRERNTSLYLLIFNLGLPDAYVDYERGERALGTSRWSFRARCKLAIDMLTTFSAAPIRVLSVTGVIVGMLGVVLGGVTVIRALFTDIPVSGWASLMVVTSIMSGIMLIALGLLGEYVWRTLDEVRQRPLYFVAREAVVDANVGDPSLPIDTIVSPHDR
jgi:dolichol-phosphate mannosyltransferase